MFGVQDALPLPGSEEEGEFGSAACHLPRVGEICGQRSNSETFSGFLNVFLNLFLHAKATVYNAVFAFQSHRVSVVREEQLEGA